MKQPNGNIVINEQTNKKLFDKWFTVRKKEILLYDELKILRKKMYTMKDDVDRISEEVQLFREESKEVIFNETDFDVNNFCGTAVADDSKEFTLITYENDGNLNTEPFTLSNYTHVRKQQAKHNSLKTHDAKDLIKTFLEDKLGIGNMTKENLHKASAQMVKQAFKNNDIVFINEAKKYLSNDCIGCDEKGTCELYLTAMEEFAKRNVIIPAEFGRQK